MASWEQSVPAGARLIRGINEKNLIDCIREAGPASRADLARLTGLSKPTVSLSLANIERAGLVRGAGERVGVPGPVAALYEINPDAGYVLGLDVGRQYVRGAIQDLCGNVRARASAVAHTNQWSRRVEDLIALTDSLTATAGIERTQVTQTIMGTPGVLDPRNNQMNLPGELTGWAGVETLKALRGALGERLEIENDINAAALAEHAHGHGKDLDSFAFVSIGTGIALGLVVGGRLHRGFHGIAGEIGYLPITGGNDTTAADITRWGGLETSASAAAIVRAAKRAGLDSATTSREVFDAAAAGDHRAAAIVAAEATLVAKAVCAIVVVTDPQLVVLGGGIGQARGFLELVEHELRKLSPVATPLKVSALGSDAVVDGCLSRGLELCWQTLTAAVSQP